MATKQEEIIYVRNARPNGVVVMYNGMRYRLEHRGHRQDSTALPAAALGDPDVMRWLQGGQLEKISKEAYNELAKRTVDILPNEFIKQPVRSPRGVEVPMRKAEGDAGNTLTQLVDTDINRTVKEVVSPKWAGDLMSTEEELESPDFQNAQETPNYPSRHREDTRERGY